MGSQAFDQCYLEFSLYLSSDFQRNLCVRFTIPHWVMLGSEVVAFTEVNSVIVSTPQPLFIQPMQILNPLVLLFWVLAGDWRMSYWRLKGKEPRGAANTIVIGPVPGARRTWAVWHLRPTLVGAVITWCAGTAVSMKAMVPGGARCAPRRCE